MTLGGSGELFSADAANMLNKVFASHLHIDHVGDFMGLHIGGWLSGRYTPIHIFGPSGSKPELGTKAAVDALMKAMAWDIKGRTGILPDAGAKVMIEFPVDDIAKR